MLLLLTQLYSIQDIMNDFLTVLVVEIISFQTHFISLIFHGTSLYGVNVLFDVSDASLRHPSKDVLMTFQKRAWLRNRYVWSSLLVVVVGAIVTTVVVVLSEAEPSSVPPSKAQLCYL